MDRRDYYISQALGGQQIVLVVNAPERRFDVLLGKELVKSVPVKGLVGRSLPFDEYAARMRNARTLSTGGGCSSTAASDRRASGPVEAERGDRVRSDAS